MQRRWSRRPLAALVVFVCAIPVARADALPDGDIEAGLAPPLLLVPRGAVLAPGGHAVPHHHGGILLEADVGAAFLLPNRVDDTQIAPTFGGRFGYELRNGLSLFARYDDLIVHPAAPSPDEGATHVVSFGARYTLPFVVPMPFVEAMAGLAIVPSEVTLGVGFGVGMTIPIVGPLFFDVGGRAWLVPLDDVLRTVLTAEVGVGFRFPVSRH